jgi:hypothetical protein
VALVLILPDFRQPCFSFKQRALKRANLYLYEFESGTVVFSIRLPDSSNLSAFALHVLTLSAAFRQKLIANC